MIPDNVHVVVVADSETFSFYGFRLKQAVFGSVLFCVRVIVALGSDEHSLGFEFFV